MVLPMSRPFLRSGTYWLRKVVPVPLRAAVGQGEFKVSLRTKDPTVAKARAREELDRIDAILASARAKLAGATTTPLADAALALPPGCTTLLNALHPDSHCGVRNNSAPSL